MVWFDCTMYALKCFTAAAMDSASISQGSQSICLPRNLALKNPASFSVSLRITYNVAPTPHYLTEPSVTNHSSSVDRGSVIVVLVCSLSFARLKASCNESFHSMCSLD